MRKQLTTAVIGLSGVVLSGCLATTGSVLDAVNNARKAGITTLADQMVPVINTRCAVQSLESRKFLVSEINKRLAVTNRKTFPFDCDGDGEPDF